jgi:transposase
MKKGQPVVLDVEETEAFLDRVKAHALENEDYDLIVGITEGYARVTQALSEKQISISRLRSMIFGVSTEKTATVFKDGAPPPEEEGDPGTAEDEAGPPKKRKGHGRRGAQAYTGATRIPIPHESLKHGEACPCCGAGKVYKEAEPRLTIWVTGSPPLTADRYEREALRCNLCGESFVAQLPEGVDTDKYDETAVSMTAVLKYGTGMPFYRLGMLQESLGIPFPPSTQWDLMAQAADRISPAFGELVRQGAQGKVIHNDDTTMKLLSAPEEHDDDKGEVEGKEASTRKGVFTTGIVSIVEDHEVAIYCTDRHHAGESLEELLQKRAEELSAPIQMCDALSRNVPKEFKTILANCIAHGRRRFVEVAASFPHECRFVLETLRDVYKYDAVAKEEGLSPEARLEFHKENSGPLMDGLKKWFEAQFAEKKVEPNSNLGKAIKYMLKHWDRLTLFLQKPGAPLDNNRVERALKLVILNRKNSYFYRTQNGADVGDLFMSLIQTSRLNGANAFEYITALQRHADKVYANPSEWMPWNYEEALARVGDPRED